MTWCTENHMVIGNDDCVEDSAVQKEIFASELAEKADAILKDPAVAQWARDYVMEAVFLYEANVRDPKLYDFWDCLQEIAEIAPKSKLAKLIKYQCKRVAENAIESGVSLK